jgi:hypothetical protein
LKLVLGRFSSSPLIFVIVDIGISVLDVITMIFQVILIRICQRKTDSPINYSPSSHGTFTDQNERERLTTLFTFFSSEKKLFDKNVRQIFMTPLPNDTLGSNKGLQVTEFLLFKNAISQIIDFARKSR